MNISKNKVLPIVKLALKEDTGKGDITTKLIIPPRRRIKAVIVARENGVVCGLDVARLVFKTADKRIRFRAITRDTKQIRAGKILARLEGRACSILKAERTALNFLGRLSGIATETFKYIQRVKPFDVQIMDTRKTTPALRILEKYAVRCGGGVNHRMGLGEQILVKDNHLAVYRKKALVELIEKIKRKKPRGMKVEVEVKNLGEFKQALLARPDIIMLDNFRLKDIKKAVEMRNAIRHRQYAIPNLEVSGGVNLDNLHRIAACGAEMISVGALTHSAKALDVALNCE